MEQSRVYGPTTSAVETQDDSSKDEVFENMDEDIPMPPTPAPIQRKPTLSSSDASVRSLPQPQPFSSTNSFSLSSESNRSSSHEISVEPLPIPQRLGRNRLNRGYFYVPNGFHQTVPTSLYVSSMDIPGPEVYHQFYLKAQDLLSEIKRLQFAFKTVGGAGPALMATEATWISFRQLVKLFGHNTWSLFPHYESSRIECLKGSVNCSDFKIAFNEAAKALNSMDGALKNFRNAYYEYRTSYRLNSLHNRLKKAAETLYVASTDEELRGQIQMHLTFLIKRIDMLREDLSSYCDKGIPIISSEQEVRSTRYLNLTTISTFLSAVTAIFLPISAEQPDGALNIAVNTLLFASLTFSIASAINSLLTVSWSKSIVHSPYFHLPVLANVCLNTGPMFSLITSAALFVAGLCLFVFSSGQHPVTSLVTVVFAGLYAVCLLALGAWLLTEKWRFHHSAPSEVRNMMDFSLSLAIMDSIVFRRRKLTESATPKYVSELESEIDDSDLPINVSCRPRHIPTAEVHDRLDGYNISDPQYIRNDGFCGGNNLDLTENRPCFPMPCTTADCPRPISPHVYAGPYSFSKDKIMVNGEDAVTSPNPVGFRRNAFLLPPEYPPAGEPGHYPSSHGADYVTENSPIVLPYARTRFMPPEISSPPSDLAHIQDYSFFDPDDHTETVQTLRRSPNIPPSPNTLQGYSSTPFCRTDFDRNIGPHSCFISRSRSASLPKQCLQDIPGREERHLNTRRKEKLNSFEAHTSERTCEEESSTVIRSSHESFGHCRAGLRHRSSIELPWTQSEQASVTGPDELKTPREYSSTSLPQVRRAIPGKIGAFPDEHMRSGPFSSFTTANLDGSQRRRKETAPNYYQDVGAASNPIVKTEGPMTEAEFTKENGLHRTK
ncbi:hypothetical protein A7U60_g769 [Sanghuangporus baumii]|uniref:Uncharacterized protein n=1 Tax=Sanghuangporus baumii TaxID=108892 RepID=A0A9Q5I5B1_SANBA|nr:hypothetical protein A7U60_g769 [Sanghuangporus baumii]